MKHQLFIAGRWVDGGSPTEISNKYTGDTIAALATARPEDLEAAVAAARKAATVMAELPAFRRAEILLGVARQLDNRRQEFATTICAEAGKAIKFATAEVDRAINTFTCAAEEAKRIHGETVPLDASPAGEHHFGFWVRRPVGVVAAITPFNFPLNLVAHKVAPALAAGNAVVLKPAAVTPLTSVLLCELLQAAGLPDGAINLIHGSGSTLGPQLVGHPHVDKITFTGSRDVGAQILAAAGIKKVTLELGNTAPVIIDRDADLDAAARGCALGAFYYSGQVCLSVQRIYAHDAIRSEFQDRLLAATAELGVGDPRDETVDVGPMISEAEAKRVMAWVDEAKQGSARVLRGASRSAATVAPTILTDVQPDMRVITDEIFGPVCSLIGVRSFDDALAQAGQTDYGLQMAVFTRDIGRVFHTVKSLNFGGIVVNDTPSFRADPMPYGGNRRSGLGREGPRFAIEDMTNIQMVSIRLGS